MSGDDGDIYAAGGAAGGAAKEYDGYSYDAPNPYANIGAIDPSTFAPMLGVQDARGLADAQIQPEYLYYEPKGWSERMFFNTGSAYLIGITTGGAYGVLNGLQTSPSNKFKIRINSILNKSGRFGSRFGNALGAIAMIYSCFEASADSFQFEQYLGGDDFVNPVIAATLTGLLYKSTQGPKTMALAGVMGGSAVAAFSAIRLAARSSGRGGGLF
mmetsp:Transcript_18132/g.29424  ORF Transcript_18132/g.29424 Transcript_18132/m.29424 type:complete len:214 (+) Transcript_18132:187-828(+)|eukprot:CAMPEP_0203744302 /NCGR_PEP_ID=MMETSP0098-20131031/424_1 /ASSEMBLY_ACC=CAM_ASM_000208 /TAXON_ID=96639 /ORGANISM=" , Strain NY0313808BC1" /LENGTH=213 /DNA_ID=CAMNT_0050631793 /DNA_START=201 /DNA_END=842 /DNA_ORIENTATION=+